MKTRFPLLFLAAVLLMAGCGSDDPAATGDAAATLTEGEIGTANFAMTFNAATGRGGGTEEGPFVLRGRNLQYVDSLSALVVDLTVHNQGRVAHPEPVTLTFVDLIPSSVTVLNPDNGVSGDGAAITFQFANDDGMWTPREESLPRTVHFGVEKGVSIGFVGQLGVGQPADRGTIGGVVWLDANEDGVMDEGEEGIAGVRIRLSSFAAANAGAMDDDDDDDDDCDGDRRGDGDDGDDCDDDNDGARVVRTGADGRYAFENVPAGAYVVSKVPSSNSGRPTTPTQIYVLLTASDGDVADFLDANFGCLMPMP